MDDALPQEGQKTEEERQVKEPDPGSVSQDDGLADHLHQTREEPGRVHYPDILPLRPDVTQSLRPQDSTEGSHARQKNHHDQNRLHPCHRGIRSVHPTCQGDQLAPNGGNGYSTSGQP